MGGAGRKKSGQVVGGRACDGVGQAGEKKVRAMSWIPSITHPPLPPLPQSYSFLTLLPCPPLPPLPPLPWSPPSPALLSPVCGCCILGTAAWPRPPPGQRFEPELLLGEVGEQVLAEAAQLRPAG